MVENEFVSDLVFDRGATSDLLLLMRGKGATGRLTVTTRRFSVRLEDAGFGDGTGELFFTGGMVINQGLIQVKKHSSNHKKIHFEILALSAYIKMERLSLF